MYSFLVSAALILPNLVIAYSQTQSLCDISHVNIVIPTTTSPYYVRYAGVGRGWYTWQCSSYGTYELSGIDIEVTDVSCIIKDSNLNPTTPNPNHKRWYYEGSDDVWSAEGSMGYILGPNPPKLAEHYTNSTYNVNTSIFSYYQDGGVYSGDDSAYLYFEADNSYTSTTTNVDETWKKYRVTQGPTELGTEVWTQGQRYGQPPASCQAGTPPINVRVLTSYFVISTSSSTYTNKGDSSAASTSKAQTLNASGVGSGALADNEDSYTSSKIQKLLNFVPVALGLLGALVALCIILVGMGIAGMLKNRRNSLPSRSIGASYQPVQLPRVKEPLYPETSYRDEVERYDAA